MRARLVFGLIVAIFSSNAIAAPIVFNYQVFQSGFNDVAVGTQITVELDFSPGLPAETAPPYDSGAPGEDQLTGSNNSQFDDLATLTVTFDDGRVINATDGQVVVGNFSFDQFRVVHDASELAAGAPGDLEFDSINTGTRTLQGINMEFRGPNSLLSDQFISSALASLTADPFAWDGVVGSGPTTQAPRRLQFNFGSPGFPEINATLVPVPAAAWLFGSAIGLLGWMRRR